MPYAVVWKNGASEDCEKGVGVVGEGGVKNGASEDCEKGVVVVVGGGGGGKAGVVDAVTGSRSAPSKRCRREHRIRLCGIGVVPQSAQHSFHAG